VPHSVITSGKGNMSVDGWHCYLLPKTYIFALSCLSVNEITRNLWTHFCEIIETNTPWTSHYSGRQTSIPLLHLHVKFYENSHATFKVAAKTVGVHFSVHCLYCNL